MNKEEKMMLKQERAIFDNLNKFLKHFDRAWYSIKEPEEELKEFFDLATDKDGVIYIFVKTKEGNFSMGYTTDIDIEDVQSLVNYLKRRADVYIRMYENG